MLIICVIKVLYAIKKQSSEYRQDVIPATRIVAKVRTIYESAREKTENFPDP